MVSISFINTSIYVSSFTLIIIKCFRYITTLLGNGIISEHLTSPPAKMELDNS